MARQEVFIFSSWGIDEEGEARVFCRVSEQVGRVSRRADPVLLCFEFVHLLFQTHWGDECCLFLLLLWSWTRRSESTSVESAAARGSQVFHLFGVVRQGLFDRVRLISLYSECKLYLHLLQTAAHLRCHSGSSRWRAAKLSANRAVRLTLLVFANGISSRLSNYACRIKVNLPMGFLWILIILVLQGTINLKHKWTGSDHEEGI